MKIKPWYLAGAAGVLVIVVALSFGFGGRIGSDHMGFGHMGSGYNGDESFAGARFVNVVGDGTVKVTPDSVRVDANISTLASSQAAALASTAQSADAFRASLKKNGVEAQYISAVNLSTNPEYSYSSAGAAKIIGYRSTQNFSVVIRDAKNAGVVIQIAQSTVGNALSINSTTSFVYDQKIAEANARTLAIAAAKAKAESYASLTGSKLGLVLSVDEQVNQSGPIPLMAMAKSAGAVAAPVQIDLGQQSITVTVTTKWELK